MVSRNRAIDSHHASSSDNRGLPCYEKTTAREASKLAVKQYGHYLPCRSGMKEIACAVNRLCRATASMLESER
jgi:hypothetical protein